MDQLARMRGMLFRYSDLFFKRIRDWGIVTIALVVVGSTELAPAAMIVVPFLVPFVFLETAYLFFYTVFARRHAEYLERAINARFGRDVLVAHRLEAAYFYPPEAPKIAAISFGDPFGLMSVATLGYTAVAGCLWLAGMVGASLYVEGSPTPVAWLPVAAGVWTVAVAGYLIWVFLRGAAEGRLLAELQRSYGIRLDPAAPDARPDPD